MAKVYIAHRESAVEVGRTIWLRAVSMPAPRKDSFLCSPVRGVVRLWPLDVILHTVVCWEEVCATRERAVVRARARRWRQRLEKALATPDAPAIHRLFAALLLPLPWFFALLLVPRGPLPRKLLSTSPVLGRICGSAALRVLMRSLPSAGRLETATSLPCRRPPSSAGLLPPIGGPRPSATRDGSPVPCNF